MILGGQTLPFFLLFLDQSSIAAFQEAPVSCVEILLSFLVAVSNKVKLTFNDVDLGKSEQPREEEN